MTGTRSVAYVHEPTDEYMGTPTDTTYKVPGKNVEVTDLSVQNALTRMGVPHQAEFIDAVEQTFEGGIGLSWTHTTPWHYDHIVGSTPSVSGSGPYTYTWSFTPGRFVSSRWYFGLDHLSGSVERETKGVVFGQYQTDVNIGEEVRVTATGLYGDEERQTDITPGSYSGENSEPMVFHGGDLEIPNSTSLVKVQSAQLQVQDAVRLQRGLQRKPLDAVLANPQTTLNLQKIITGTSQLALAYGNSTAPVTNSGVDGAATGTLTFGTSGTPEVAFNLDTVTPDNYNWTNLANKDEDTLEDIEYFVDSLEIEATSDESSAL